MLRIHIITQNEPFYIPKMISYLVRNQSDEYKITSFTILQPHRKNKSLLHWFNERAKVYKFSELIIAGLAYFIVNFANSIPIFKNHLNAKNHLVLNNSKEIETQDINSSTYVELLKRELPDVIVSISCPQIFKEDILNVPTRICINAHGTLLPRHRGVFGTWWTLFSNDIEAGGTIHSMELKLDAGEILWQQSFKVKDDDTQFSLAYKTKKIMSIGLVDVFSMLFKHEVSKIDVKYYESYHKAPTKELGIEFHKNGNRVIVLKDLPSMLSNSF